MDLIDCASWFDDTQVRDPDTLDTLFLGQLDVYDDSKRDGVGTERRILSIDPRVAVTLPASGVVVVDDQRWVTGWPQEMPDVFQGEAIRHKIILQRAPHTFEFAPARVFLTDGATPEMAYCGAVWTKDMKYESYSSEVRSFFTLWVSQRCEVEQGELVRFGAAARMHYVRNVYDTSTGLRAVEAVELPVDCLQTVTWQGQGGGFDGVQGTVVDAPQATAPAVVMQFFDEYRLVTQAMLKPSRGDLMVRVRREDLPQLRAGDRFVLVDGSDLRVVTYLDEVDDTYLMHLTR